MDETSEVGDRVTYSQVIRRQDLIELSANFVRALTPLGTVIEQLAHAHQAVKDVRRVVLLCVILVLLSFLLAVVLLFRMEASMADMETLHRKNEALARSVAQATVEIRKTKSVAERTEKRAAEQTTVQLVPETDPAKARRSPVKLVIEAAPKDAPERAVSEQAGTTHGTPASRDEGAKYEIPLPKGAF